jgi:hypothetical protein
VAETARGLLTEKTRAAIIKILKDDDLAAVATWSDEVREAARGKGPLLNDPEVIQFNKKFPHNDLWHYVNLPLATPEYQDKGAFSTTNDVVHAINNCIARLEGKANGLTKLQALRVLVHLAGDIHQPLHVGTGYYQTDEADSAVLITAPDEALGKPDDVGGNDLFYGPGRFDELHAFWDGVLVKDVGNTTSPHRLTAILTNIIDATAFATPGDRHQWAEKWASDSVKTALQAYHGLTFTDPQFNTHHILRRVSITFPANYEQDSTAVVEMQLAKAAFHLAALLNQIKWK